MDGVLQSEDGARRWHPQDENLGSHDARRARGRLERVQTTHTGIRSRHTLHDHARRGNGNRGTKGGKGTT